MNLKLKSALIFTFFTGVFCAAQSSAVVVYPVPVNPIPTDLPATNLEARLTAQPSILGSGKAEQKVKTVTYMTDTAAVKTEFEADVKSQLFGSQSEAEALPASYILKIENAGVIATCNLPRNIEKKRVKIDRRTFAYKWFASYGVEISQINSAINGGPQGIVTEKGRCVAGDVDPTDVGNPAILPTAQDADIASVYDATSALLYQGTFAPELDD